MARLTVPRVVMALIGALLLTYAFAVAPSTRSGSRDEVTSDRLATAGPGAVVTAEANAVPTAERSPSPPPARELFPPAGKAFIGVHDQQGPATTSRPWTAFAAAAKHQPQVMLFSVGWAARPVRPDTLRPGQRPRHAAHAGLGAMGLPTGRDGPQEAAARPPDRRDPVQPDPTTDCPASPRASFDSYLRSWADGIRSLGYPVAIRFAHEMNGDWYPWCEKVNGNQPGDYVKAWRHVHDVFRPRGATNVIWVWSPNVQVERLDPELVRALSRRRLRRLGRASRATTARGPSRGTRSFDSIFNPTIAGDPRLHQQATGHHRDRRLRRQRA